MSLIFSGSDASTTRPVTTSYQTESSYDEDRIAELEEENEDLRDCLASTSNDIEEARYYLDEFFAGEGYENAVEAYQLLEDACAKRMY